MFTNQGEKIHRGAFSGDIENARTQQPRTPEALVQHDLDNSTPNVTGIKMAALVASLVVLCKTETNKPEPDFHFFNISCHVTSLPAILDQSAPVSLDVTED